MAKFELGGRNKFSSNTYIFTILIIFIIASVLGQIWGNYFVEIARHYIARGQLRPHHYFLIGIIFTALLIFLIWYIELPLEDLI